MSANSMTPDQYRVAIAKLGYSQERFAELVGSNRRTGQKWALGESRLPGSVIVLLRLLLARPELVSVIEGMSSPPPRVRSKGKD